MVFLHPRTLLTPAERSAKRRLVIQDTLALLSLFAITALLAVLTFLLFRSYSQHEKDLAARWLRRGDAALAAGQPQQAINALRSALAFQPDNRQTQIKLAEALASAGRIQEATAYFNTLWDKEPGSGIINLQLARLATRTVAKHVDNARRALEYYHAAIYGTWEGDGAERRRDVRLELVRYELSKGMFADARNELLIAAGNADQTNTAAMLEVARLLEQAHAPSDALHLYKQILARRETSFAALEGAGHSAFALGRFRTAKQYLERALARPDASQQSEVDNDRKELAQSKAILDLYPTPTMPARERAERVLKARDIARKRFFSCVAPKADPAANTVPAALPPDLAALNIRWQAEPKNLTLGALIHDPRLQQQELDLVYDTELKTVHDCGTPTGDDALLLRIAQSPDAVEQP
jgi:tetratricopeptide (TPR) repeat protein